MIFYFIAIFESAKVLRYGRNNIKKSHQFSGLDITDSVIYSILGRETSLYRPMHKWPLNWYSNSYTP